MTFENALKKIQAKFDEINASKLADMAVQVTLTDEDCGGTLYFKSTNGTVDVQGYDYRDNDAVIDIERKAFMDILSGKSTLDKVIEKGQATAKGDFEKLRTLDEATKVDTAAAKKEEAKVVETKTEAKPVAKKTVAKKTETVAKKAPAKKAAATKTAAKQTASKKA